MIQCTIIIVLTAKKCVSPSYFPPKSKFYLLMQKGGLNLYKTTSDLFLRNDPTLTLKVNFFVNLVTELTYFYGVKSVSFQLKVSCPLLKVYARGWLSVTIAIRSRSWHFRPQQSIWHYGNLSDHSMAFTLQYQILHTFLHFCENTAFDVLFSPLIFFVSKFDDK